MALHLLHFGSVAEKFEFHDPHVRCQQLICIRFGLLWNFMLLQYRIKVVGPQSYMLQRAGLFEVRGGRWLLPDSRRFAQSVDLDWSLVRQPLELTDLWFGYGSERHFQVGLNLLLLPI